MEKASIEYWPVCSYCHTILQHVDYIDHKSQIEGSKAMCFLATEIEPYSCPNCGSVFETIKIATHFPFSGYSGGD